MPNNVTIEMQLWLIIPGVQIALGILSKSVHTTKKDGDHILNPRVTPEDITIDKRQRLIIPALNQIPHRDMALLIQKFIALSWSSSTWNLTNLAPLQFMTPCKQNPLVGANWLIESLDGQRNMDAKQPHSKVPSCWTRRILPVWRGSSS